MSGQRSYDEFMRLKKEICELVTVMNADQLLEFSARLMREKMKNLDVKNITEVEDLYLIGGLLTQAASYVAAQKKVEAKRISFDSALASTGADEVRRIITDAFKKYPGVEKEFDKIHQIDDVFKPAKQAWACTHAQMQTVANYFKNNPVTGDDLEEINSANITLEEIMIHLYRTNLACLEVSLKEFGEPKRVKSDKEQVLLTKAQDTLKQVKAIAGEYPEKLSKNDLKDLNDVLICTHASLKDCHDKEKSTKHAQALTDLAQRVSGKSSKGWKTLGISLLTFACAVLVVVGVLAAIPSGGGSLLLTAIGAAGLSATIGAGASVAALGMFGGAAIHHGREKGLAKSLSDLSESTKESPDEPSISGSQKSK